jgi:hypothetical protein
MRPLIAPGSPPCTAVSTGLVFIVVFPAIVLSLTGIDAAERSR